MSKRRYFIAAVGICCVVAVVLRLLTTERVSEQQVVPSRSEGVRKLLEDLTYYSVAKSSGTWTAMSSNDTAAYLERRQRSQEALKTLRASISLYLPQLMEEVYETGRIAETNRSAAVSIRVWQLQSAFMELGEEVRPLLPQLKEEFYAGRSLGPSSSGLLAMGGTDSALILVSGITNSNRKIRSAALHTLSWLKTNREVVLASVDPVLLILKDDSTDDRIMATLVLGVFKQKPDVVIPELLQAAKGDPDRVVRSQAVKAIGRFGTNAAIAKKDLVLIAVMDHEATVRRGASLAVRKVSGEIPPDD